MKFLSPEWVERLNRELQAAGVRLDSGQASLCVQHMVEQIEGETLSYWVKVDAAGASAGVGVSDEPTVTFTQSLEVAASIAQRRQDVHVAFLMGEIKVSGDVMELLGQEDITVQIIEITSGLNQATDFG